MKGFMRVARLMRDDREWRVLGVSLVGFSITAIAFGLLAGTLAMIGLAFGVILGSVITGIINQMGRWS